MDVICYLYQPQRQFLMGARENEFQISQNEILRGLHTTNLSLQTRVGKLKLVCVNGTKTVGKHVGKLLATNRTCLYSRQLFRQLFRVGKLEFDV